MTGSNVEAIRGRAACGREGESFLGIVVSRGRIDILRYPQRIMMVGRVRSRFSVDRESYQFGHGVEV